MKSLRFNLDSLVRQTQATGAAEDGGEQTTTLLDNLPINVVKSDHLKFTEMGGTPVIFRASFVRLAFMKLLITGVIAGIVAVRTEIDDVAWSCALAAAVNTVACVHYMLIWKVRAQSMPDGFMIWASGVGTKGNWVGAKADKHDDEKIYIQEIAVDGLRHSDWAVTLWVMTLDLYHLAAQATDNAEPWISKFWAATIVPFVVFFGALYRFYANEGRTVGGKPMGWPQFLLAFFGVFLSCVCLAVVMYGIVSPFFKVTPAAGSDAEADATAVWILTMAWLGYPMLLLVTRSLQMCFSPDGSKFNAWISALKDIVYAVLDVTSKGGLALYVCLRSTWIKPDVNPFNLGIG